MALWQFDLILAPRAAPAPVRSEDGWVAQPIEADLVASARAWLTERLGEPWLMTEGFLVFGPENGSRFDVLLVEDGSAEVTVRIDAGSESKGFCDTVGELARLLDSVPFAMESRTMLEANGLSIHAALSKSKAAAFVSNPREYIKNVGNEG